MIRTTEETRLSATTLCDSDFREWADLSAAEQEAERELFDSDARDIEAAFDASLGRFEGQPCPSCGGSGFAGDSADDCPTCGGMGTI